MKIEQIEAEFGGKGIKRGELLLLPSEVAIELVHRCKEENLKILGIDGFFINDDITQPLMEHSIDLTNESIEKRLTLFDSYKIAEIFLNKRIDSTLFFEIIID